jgi:lipopolysaccharide/colanic/teichoic acid biosynthesis glycosyltransferase/UDP-N-acetylmuramyl pentapeptide phosphotransferase/UDP-N-acetylglucosamine-1-phosphate transferase
MIDQFEQYLIDVVPFFIGIISSFIILSRMKLFCSSGKFFKTVDDVDEGEGSSCVEIGGVAIFPILLTCLCASLGLPKWLGYDDVSAAAVERSGLRIMQVISGCALLYIVGLKNDIHGTAIKVKLLALFLTACLFPVSRLWIMDLQGLFGIYELPVWIGMPITVCLVMYITEAIVILDDIDGIGAGYVAIIGTIFLGFCIAFNFTLGALVSSALLGVAVPYSILKLFFKGWQKTLLGNAGSYTLGYFVSYLTLSLIQQSGEFMPEGMLMIVVGITFIPFVDVIRIIRNRVREGRAMLTPDRNQMQHRLIRAGINISLTPICIILIVIIFAFINTFWVLKGYNLTILAGIDLALWTALQFSISYAINKHENHLNFHKWNMEYGRDAWEANVPVEVIKRKQKVFGTMGLPKDVILGEETDFIPDGMNSFERNVKRLVDMNISAIMLVLTSPLFLLSYMLIKLDDGGPAIYRQVRIGRFGRPFYIYKFRSMRLDAEKFGPALSHAGGDDDPRLTRVGKFLRAHHLDELPQLWNVFCGDMAFIGYRPERKFFIDQIMEHDPRYSFLYQIRPGVTSYATLYNGYTDTMEKMLRRLNYDLYYLEHRSFWFDIKTLWLTFVSIIFGKKF